MIHSEKYLNKYRKIIYNFLIICGLDHIQARKMRDWSINHIISYLYNNKKLLKKLENIRKTIKYYNKFKNNK